MDSIRTKTKCWFNFPQATVLCFECVCVLLVRLFDIHQVLWCRFYVNSKLHIWKTNWGNVNLSPSIFFLSSYFHNVVKYFLEENSHFHEITKFRAAVADFSLARPSLRCCPCVLFCKTQAKSWSWWSCFPWIKLKWILYSCCCSTDWVVRACIANFVASWLNDSKWSEMRWQN